MYHIYHHSTFNNLNKHEIQYVEKLTKQKRINKAKGKVFCFKPNSYKYSNNATVKMIVIMALHLQIKSLHKGVDRKKTTQQLRNVDSNKPQN